MATVRSFKDLQVWQRSMELARVVYTLTAELPQEERYGLIGQMRRCAVSIPSNIAEGSKRGSRKDYVQFLNIANGSVAELETQLILAHDIYKIDISDVSASLEEIQKMLTTLIKKLSQS